MNRLFCDSIERPSFCVYKDYEPVICCAYCDKRSECWQTQDELEEKIPCHGQNVEELDCEMRF